MTRSSVRPTETAPDRDRKVYSHPAFGQAPWSSIFWFTFPGAALCLWAAGWLIAELVR